MALPEWSALSDSDKAQVVLFLRTAADEGLTYAWEEYRPGWRAGSALNKADSGQQLRRAYGDVYEALDDDEFWRLYDLAEQAENEWEAQKR